jgi:hypothetical protein
MLILIAAVLIAIGGYFFLAGETAVDDDAPVAAEPAVPLAPSAVGDTAVPPAAPAPEPPAQDLIPSPE